MKVINVFSFLFTIFFIFGACYVDVYEIGNSSSSHITYSDIVSSSTNSSSSQLVASYDSIPYQGYNYKAKKIGSQVWIIENLRAEPSSGKSWCWGTINWQCTLTGKLYDWTAAMSVCPAIGNGWRLPGVTDYNNLSNLGSLLGAAVGWNAYKSFGGSKNEDEDDLLGYTALNEGFWWGSNDDGNLAYYVNLKENGIRLDGNYFSKARGLSVRCVKDI